MARTGVSYEAVEQVAKQLYQQGVHPTVQRVRNELGTGSNTTISRHLKTWHETFSDQIQSQLPMEVPEEIVASVDGFWVAAVAKADENYQKYREEIESQRDLAVEEKAAALLHLEQVQQHNQQLQNELADAQQIIQEQKSAFLKLQGQYDELGKNFESSVRDAKDTKVLAQAAMDQADQAQQAFVSRLTEQKLHDENIIKDLKQQLQDEKIRYEASENRHVAKINELQQSIKQAEQHNAELDKTLSDQQKQNETNQQLFHQQFKHIESQYNNTNQQLKQAQDDNLSLKQEIKNTRTNFNTSSAQNEKIISILTQSVDNQDQIFKQLGNLESKFTSALPSQSELNQDN